MKPEPLVVVKTLRASRERVFQAWATAESVKRWFAPQGCTCPEAEVDFRVGGAFHLVLEVPGALRHAMRMIFTHIEAPERLGFAGTVEDGGKAAFRVDTDIRFEAVPEGTKVTVTQAYEIYDPKFAAAISGARQGWNSTLANLERVASARSVAHGQFTVRRALAATPETVFRAFTDPEAKAKWFVGPEGWRLLERTMDVRVGGRERVKGQFAGGLTTTFDAVYFDVVANERLIYAYEMHLDDRKISASLATLTVAPDAKGALLTLTEQGVFLDGYDDAGSREQGTQALLDAVERSLTA
jgi:uncharacterized protein YndB with AHSA1/START domain